ncbi:MAG: putative bifunctional diguanylate cyclase/phosphodiesterase [Rehaibacterium terrae]|uniref:putative bifunctional diguanylate cyclase/phosphodiesterase n=1 Tax=Rehaibacterium terrae TaxID=1341696 RepID=UPI0039189827
MRYGLQARVLTILALVLGTALVVLAALWWQYEDSQEELAGIGREAVHELAMEGLRRRGAALSSQLAEAIANPLYYFDLDTIGELSRSVLRQPDVAYVIVFDAEGRVVHDGSSDIPGYGQPMDDPFAAGAIAAQSLRVQWSAETMDVTQPIFIGDERIGGVRLGFSLAVVGEQQSRADALLRQGLGAIAQRNLYWLAALLAALTALGVAVLVLVSRGLVRPIRQLAEAARAVEIGRYERVQLDTRRGDELGDLIRAFKRMSESVDRHDRDIRRMAYGDSLTGLPNRLAFRELLDQRLLTLQASGGELALLFLDVDDFKRVNDTLGHDAGDEVLAQFATRIRQCVERIGGDGAEVARFGGDEFVALILGQDMRATASRLADAIILELQQPIEVLGREVFLGASVGITLFPHDAAGAGLLLKNGDIAMYQAKVAGKNCYRFYSKAMNQAVERRVQMEQDLRGAWERGELSLHYQPVFRLADGALVGAEALLRWQHPLHGVIPPAVFIDVAEQSGLIEALGRHVLARACEDAQRWQVEQGEAPFVSVNISARQLRGGDLPEVVAATLKDSGLAPERLHIELTETAVLGDEVQASALLSRLRALGVKIWLDDFGTGFSGLSHLRRVPVDGVKIDRSFVADVLRDPDDLALTSAIIAMAHSLGITVVAEGVENEGQYAVLRERNCDLAQGFWLGRPMAMQELMRRLAG